MILSRRKFLNTVVISASAVAVTSLVGCGTDSDELTQGSDECGNSAASGFFKHSIMSGDPRQNSVILWTRIEDTCELAANNDVSLVVEVATDKEFSNLLISEAVSALAQYDHNIKLRITGLTSDTRYYYRFAYVKDDVVYSSNTGRTRTAQDSLAVTQRPVRFAYVSCQDFVGRYYNNYLSLLTDTMLDGGDDADDQGLDFVVHLGDYIYETTGDPEFQAAAGERIVSFSDLAGAIKMGSEDAPFYAAQSLDNYRELYKTYRTDELLQKVQENFPMIVTWDDHEFSDDSWQDTSTYLNGIPGETNQSTRKQNSERAYFECMPIDHEFAFDNNQTDVTGNGSENQTAMGISDEQLFPNTKIYRDFTFGNKVHLLMSDFRSHRPDHLIAEDTFPGVMAMTEQNIIDTLAVTQRLPAAQAAGYFATIKSSFDTYFNIDDLQYTSARLIVTGAARESYKSAALESGKILSDAELTALASQVTGMQSVAFINLVLQQAVPVAEAAGSIVAGSTYEDYAIEAEEDAPAGISYFLLGKTSFFGEIGSRYFVVKDTFDLFAAYKNLLAEDKTANPYGTEQMTWMATKLASSTQNWRLLGSSVSFSPLVLDLRSLARGRPAISASDITAATGFTENVAGMATYLDSLLEQVIAGLEANASTALLANRFYLNVDHWDGFPVYKSGLMSSTTQADVLGKAGVITIAGDVHSSYVGKQPLSSNGETRSFDLTTSSISSGTFGQFMNGALAGILEGLTASGAELDASVMQGIEFLQANWSVLVQSASGENSGSATKLQRARLNEHGVVSVVAKDDNIDFTYHAIDDSGDLVTTNYYADSEAFLGNVNQTTYRIEDNDISEL